MISYAQNAEDVVLERAFRGRDSGLYIDVGAADPNNHSVTRHFYDKGWRGINIDPLPAWHEQLEAARPGDVNLLLGISDEPGEMVLHVGEEHPGGATFSGEQGQRYQQDGMSMSQVTARLVTLAQVCAEWVGDRDVDFLKIDCEGFELKVIKGADWKSWRPRVVLVEATEPNSPVPNHQAWEPMLLAAGYIHTLFDGLNRFYVRAEDHALAQVLAAPANVFDDFVPQRYAAAAAEPPGVPQVSIPTTSPAPPAPDYAFDRRGMSPGRAGQAVVPLRQVLRRAQRPWFDRQVEILLELRHALDAAEERIEGQQVKVDALEAELRLLRSRLEAGEARSWDQAAFARRLAAIEDSLPSA